VQLDYGISTYRRRISGWQPSLKAGSWRVAVQRGSISGWRRISRISVASAAAIRLAIGGAISWHRWRSWLAAAR